MHRYFISYAAWDANKELVECENGSALLSSPIVSLDDVRRLEWEILDGLKHCQVFACSVQLIEIVLLSVD